MSVIRNFIEITGIAKEEDLPEKSFGQLIKYSEAEHIVIPREKSGIKDIYQIGLGVEVKSRKIINTVDCKTVVIDGTKTYKIVCTQYENPEKVVMLNIQQPYNTFFELPNQIKDIENVYVHTIDAFFQVLEKRRVYGHFIYLVDVRYSDMNKNYTKRKYDMEEGTGTYSPKGNLAEPQIALSGFDIKLMDEEVCSSIALSQKKNEKVIMRDIDCEYL